MSQEISREGDTIALILCLCIATAFVIFRTGARWFKLRSAPMELEDIFMYLALVAFIIMTALYLDIIPVYFDLMAISAGLKQPYATLENDLLIMLKEFFVVQFFFWLTLWAVKWSLLFMFKKTTEGLALYSKIWWGILVFSILTFIATCVTNFTSCSSMEAWFTVGGCNLPRDAWAKNFSLWFSLASDLTCDVLIMIIPLRVLWDLKMSLIEKISIGVVFMVGFITMITAIIRSVSLDSSVSGGQVSTTWLMLWAAIEGSVAIIVGCLPSFAIFIRGRIAASRATGQSSSKGPSSYYLQSRSRKMPGSVVLEEEDPWNGQDAASNKSLVEGGIVVTQGWSQKWQSEPGAGAKRAQEIQEEYNLVSIQRDKSNA